MRLHGVSFFPCTRSLRRPSWPYRSGAGLAEVGQVLRHASVLTTSIYAKLDTAGRRWALLLVVRRGFDLVEGGSSAADFCDDLFGGLVPDEGLGVVVPVFGPDLDGIDEVGHAGEHASA